MTSAPKNHLEGLKMQENAESILFTSEKYGSEVIRHHHGSINPGVLDKLRSRSINTFQLELFDGKSIVCEVTRYDNPTPDSESWSGTIQNIGGNFTMISSEGNIFINVHTPDSKVYSIRPLSSKQYSIVKIDPEKLPPEFL